MNNYEEPTTTRTSRRQWLGFAVLVAVFFAFAMLIPKAPRPASPTGTGGARPANGRSDGECQRRLRDVIDGLHPERVVITSNRLDRVAELQQWAIDCAATVSAIDLKYDEQANQQWLSGELAEQTQSGGYSLRDAEQITTSRLGAEIVAAIVPERADAAERAVRLFDFVVAETIDEPGSNLQALPRTPLESLLVGRAGPADRAWILAGLLRQSGVDAVVIAPQGDKSDSWLIGAIRPDGDVWLFDPQLGLPVPAAGGIDSNGRITRAATLSEARADPSLLRQLDLEGTPFPLQAGDLAQVSVRLIGDSSLFSRRMAVIQSRLSGVTMEVFDGLGGSAVRRPGLVERVVTAGQGGLWTRSDVSVWTVPEERLDSFFESGAESSAAWQRTTTVFAGPLVAAAVHDLDDRSHAAVQKSRHPLRDVRMIHLSGRYQDALRLYGPIRFPGPLPRDLEPGMARSLQNAMPDNAAAADFASFWSARCQFEMQRADLALQTLDQYDRDFPLGSFLAAVPELRARALVVTGNTAQAVQFLDGLPSRLTSPRLAWLAQRLRSTAGSALNPTEPGNSTAAPEAAPGTDVESAPAAQPAPGAQQP